MEKRCDSCLYNDNCRSVGNCPYYLPADYDIYMGERTDDLETYRKEFYKYSKEYE